MAENILLFDIETAPCISHLWGLYQEVNSTEFIKEDWYVICWCAKWLGKRKIFSSYSKTSDDSSCVKALWKLLDKADIVIAHNGDRFDVKKINTRFIIHGLKPPSPYRTIDTLKTARGKFKFTSNRLNDLGQYLDVGKKLPTGGFDLWRRSMLGEQKAIDKMVKYCAQDVRLLEKVYLKLRPWMPTHPNIAVLKQKGSCCPKCGSEKIQFRGYSMTNSNRFHRLQCNSCGGWSRLRTSDSVKTLSGV